MGCIIAGIMNFYCRICYLLIGGFISYIFNLSLCHSSDREILLQVHYEGKAAVWILDQGNTDLLDRSQGKYGGSLFICLKLFCSPYHVSVIAGGWNLVILQSFVEMPLLRPISVTLLLRAVQIQVLFHIVLFTLGCSFFKIT